MRILILTDNGTQDPAWAEALREQDHTPLRVAGQFDSPAAWFTRVKVEAARADCVIVGFTSMEMPETLAFVCGYAEAAGVQCVLVTPTEGGIACANTRNVRYASFEEALARYFATTRAARAKQAIK